MTVTLVHDDISLRGGVSNGSYRDSDGSINPYTHLSKSLERVVALTILADAPRAARRAILLSRTWVQTTVLTSERIVHHAINFDPESLIYCA
jgi:hypothetical protein